MKVMNFFYLKYVYDTLKMGAFIKKIIEKFCTENHIVSHIY